MKVAVEGCCHGELDAIYEHISRLEKKNNYKVDLLLICGDFQAVRNYLDLECMSVPPKYRQEGDFPRYYVGAKKAPILTLVIGGNHEASNYFWELYHGGWLAQNIYYMGCSGCVNVNGIRIAGASGIYHDRDYALGHFEALPYDQSQIRSIYHIRKYDVFKLSQLSPLDIFLSHDWPQGIAYHGNLPGLLSRKSFFRADIESGKLGSPPLMNLLKSLKPSWWFAAHLHVKFEACFEHRPSPSQSPPIASNPDEIAIDELDVETALFNPDEISIDADSPRAQPMAVVAPASPNQTGSSYMSSHSRTQFLALDKCLPKRDFLQVIDIETPMAIGVDGPVLKFDTEWLAVSRALHPYLSTSRNPAQLPSLETARELISREIQWVADKVDAQKQVISSVQRFWKTAPSPLTKTKDSPRGAQPSWYTNPQTEAFCTMLEIPNKVNPPPG